MKGIKEAGKLEKQAAEDPAEVRRAMMEIAQQTPRIKGVNVNGHGPITINLDISGQREYENDIEVNPETGVIALYFDKSHSVAMELLRQYRNLGCLNGTRERLRIDSSIAYPY